MKRVKSGGEDAKCNRLLSSRGTPASSLRDERKAKKYGAKKQTIWSVFSSYLYSLPVPGEIFLDDLLSNWRVFHLNFVSSGAAQRQ